MLFSIFSIARGLLGIFILLGICFLLSKNRKKVNWRLVLSGVILQIVFALLIFKVSLVKDVFEAVAKGFTILLSFTFEGADFVFGAWPDLVNVGNSATGEIAQVGYIFVFKVLPTIVFFSALTSLLYYLGILQKVVKGIAWVMMKAMRLSGSESLAAAGNIFLGQTEAPLLVKPYIPRMTKSEINALMTGGMATIAGGVLAAYIQFLGGASQTEQLLFATHLLSASIMSAPAALLIAKILIPETDKINTDLTISKNKIGKNILEAITNGTTEGVKLAVNVGAMLLVFTAFVAMLNYFFALLGNFGDINSMVAKNNNFGQEKLSLQYFLGILFAPFALVIGVPMEDIFLAGQLIGEKTVLNEFFAYMHLSEFKNQRLFSSEKSIIILTYALSGFSNIASIGIQIGGISSIAPNKKTILSQMAIYALIGGTFACLMTAAVAGMFF
ncbi:MAG: nucleoside transporter C-terminal domain-containing protein [Bacteroidota bacterium]|nr:nucleoside transporter C-terminal domain-containing protein [Bacteroidota bacterium]